MTEPGRFVLVVGPSGAGKDTLIAGAREHLADDARFIFPERLITRDSMPEAEVHGTIGFDTFAQMMAEGRYALAWEAHGLGYVIPTEVAEQVAAGSIAICNASRRIVDAALSRYPGTHVIVVDADIEVRAARLAGRGRESAEDIAQRLAREVPPLPESASVSHVGNSGAVGDGIARFVALLDALADADEARSATA